MSKPQKVTLGQKLEFGLRRAARYTRNAPRVVNHCLRFKQKRQFVDTLQNTYYTNYINLSMAFRETRADSEIRALARQAVFNYLTNAVERTFPEIWEGFEVQGLEVLDAALARGKGAIVVSQHLGPEQFTFLELATRGYMVNASITENAIPRSNRWIAYIIKNLRGGKHAIDGAKIATNLRIIRVEEPSSALKMVRALRRSELVMFNLDGNFGAGDDDARRAQKKVRVNLLGREILARKGAAYLSYKTGAPIVPVIPLWLPGQRPRLTFYEPLVAGEGEELEDFCQRTIQQMYGQLEAHVLADPAQWEVWSEFYKWMSPAEKINEAEKNGAAVRAHFDYFSRALEESPEMPLRVDPERAFIVRMKRQDVLVDLRNFRFFLVPSSTAEVLKLLYRGVTLQSVVAALRRRHEPGQVLKELTRLRVLRLLEVQAEQV